MTSERRPVVAVLDDYEGALGSSSRLAPLRERVDLRVHREPLTGHRLAAALADVDIVVAIRERTSLDGSTLDAFEGVELILQTGGHAYHVDPEAATARGIVVALGRGSAGSSQPSPVVAELVFGLIISWFRNLPSAVAEMREGGWPSSLGRSLHGCRLGILGLGRHGSQVAALGRAFGMDTVAWSPRLTADRAAEHGARRLELDELLTTSDVVTVHLALAPATRGLLGRRELDLLSTGTLLVNTSRGPIVDEAALVDALRAGHIGGAALDVFDREPLPADHPLRTLDNTICTPHLGYTVDAAFDDFARTTASQLLAYLDGQLPAEVLLNPEVLRSVRLRPAGIAGGVSQ